MKTLIALGCFLLMALGFVVAFMASIFFFGWFLMGVFGFFKDDSGDIPDP